MSSGIKMDWQRTDRTGLGEAVMGSGKSLSQLQSILLEAEQRQSPLLFTRIAPEIFQQLGTEKGQLDFDEPSRCASYWPEDYKPAESENPTAIAVVTGGGSDLPVAREAVRTLQFYGYQPAEIYDVGVAGLWRVEEQLPLLQQQKIIICIAGMDAALPTVLGGLVPGLIIAVPTSTGYGMAKGGETALNALLCSCAQGLVVVNIDNGFGAACAALRVLAKNTAS